MGLVSVPPFPRVLLPLPDIHVTPKQGGGGHPASVGGRRGGGLGPASHPDRADGGQDGPDAASRRDQAMHQPRLRARTVEGETISWPSLSFPWRTGRAITGAI